MDKQGSHGAGAGQPDSKSWYSSILSFRNLLIIIVEPGPTTSGTLDSPKPRLEVRDHSTKPATRYYPYQHHASRTPHILGTSASKPSGPSHTPSLPLSSSPVSVSDANATAEIQPYPQGTIKYLRDMVRGAFMIWYEKTKLVWDHCNDERDGSSNTEAGRDSLEEGEKLRSSMAFWHERLMEDLEKLHQAHAEALAYRPDKREDDSAGSQEVEKTMTFQKIVLGWVEIDRISESLET
ncbi:hypothetical protein N431DRAFT_39302 [Stipitochalara longipes BDJ]|nr:hypothetical protein N431DRAFT_39302 [Stipitochalara longipes BDJ]